MSKKEKMNLRNRAYKFLIRIINLVDTLPKKTSSQIIGKQLIRSVTSIGANIIEAKSSSSRKEFINFYNYSLKSANESKFWLALLKDTKLAKKSDIEYFLKETDELSKIIASSIITMKRNIK